MKISRRGPRSHKKTPLSKAVRLPLPNERDEAVEEDATAPRKVMNQAYQDLQRGLVDTDLHGQRGVEAQVRKDSKK
jgi:hypothetical protein